MIKNVLWMNNKMMKMKIVNFKKIQMMIVKKRKMRKMKMMKKTIMKMVMKASMNNKTKKMWNKMIINNNLRIKIFTTIHFKRKCIINCFKKDTLKNKSN